MSNPLDSSPTPPPAQNPGTLEPQGEPTGKRDLAWAQRIRKQVLGINTGVILGAITVSLIIGALIVVAFDKEVQNTATYFFARPSDFLSEAGATFQSFFSSLVRGAIFDYRSATAAGAIKPIFETLTMMSVTYSSPSTPPISCHSGTWVTARMSPLPKKRTMIAATKEPMTNEISDASKTPTLRPNAALMGDWNAMSAPAMIISPT